MKTVRWGIIGCGNVTEVKSGPGFHKADGSQLVAVMRRDAAKAEDYARRHSVPRWYSDADALIGDPGVDAVYIATPPGTHEHCALKVCAAGKPCYVEKPMSRNAAEARRMVEAFQRARLPFFVAYYRRALPRFLKVKELLAAGAIGAIQSAEYRYADGKMRQREEPLPWRLSAEDAGGGLFLDLGSHVLDMLDFWLGPLKGTDCRAWNSAQTFAVEDHVALNFASPSGALGSVKFDFTASAAADEFEVRGEKGIVRISCFGNEPVRLTHKDGREESFNLPNPPHVAQPLIQTVVDALRGTGTCPSSGESALRTQVLMDWALESYYGGREDGFWKRPWPGNKLPA